MIDDSDDVITIDKSETSAECPVHHSAKKHKLTDEEVVKFAMSFLGAGYKTTANTISYTSYLLALNPDVQEQLQSEIDSYFDDKLCDIKLKDW